MKTILLLSCLFVYILIGSNKLDFRDGNNIITGKEHHNVLAYSANDLKHSNVYNFALSISKLYPQFDTVYVKTFPKINNSATTYTVKGITFLIVELKHNRQLTLTKNPSFIIID